MSLEKIAGSDLAYHLVSFDEKGRPRPDADGVRPADELIAALSAGSISDIFLMTHDWKGDWPAARAQFQEWVGAMARCKDDLRQARERCPTFNPLIVGLHWPSLPWGDEAHPASPASYDTTAIEVEELVASAAATLSDSARARNALRILFEAALTDADPPQLPKEVHQAYVELEQECSRDVLLAGGLPDMDREPFQPEVAFLNGRSDATTYGSFTNALLSPLIQLSFWRMKDRARQVGEEGMFELLNALLSAADASIRFHLMGHSFGCIAASATLAGPGGRMLSRPVSSLFLVQGALSLWSYCSEIALANGVPGYFRRVLDSSAVQGPIVTTRSQHDTAVGRLYPLAAGVAGQIVLDAPTDLPRYGGVGAFGLQGPGIKAIDLDMTPLGSIYDFERGTVYNVDAGTYICEGGGLSGAHNDISKPEVAHAFWQAALSTF